MFRVITCTVLLYVSGVTLNPSGAKVTIADIQAVNGVVHAIDAVMIPSDLQITRRSLIP